jgi:c-di-AMP phosphodiesterase-like protein
MAYIDEETVSISARSKGIIDVSSIMQLFGGGGNETSAAARIKGKSIHEVKQMLSQILIPSYLISIDGIKDNLDIFKDNKGEELQLRLI